MSEASSSEAAAFEKDVQQMAAKLYDALCCASEGTCWSDAELAAIMGAETGPLELLDKPLRRARHWFLNRRGLFLARVRGLGFGLAPTVVGAYSEMRSAERLLQHAWRIAKHTRLDDLTPVDRDKRLRALMRCQKELRWARRARKDLETVLQQAEVP